METNWAAENLQTIRTLMERSAIYRRALAPVMTYVGLLGIVAAVASNAFNLEAYDRFIYYWAGVCTVAVSVAFLLIRRQAIKSAEPFWTPPTRRVVEAMSPAFVLAALITLFALVLLRGSSNSSSIMLPPVWIALYGCGVHAGGFFMPRGIKALGWAFILFGVLLVALNFITPLKDLLLLLKDGDLPMGASFGGMHFAYGIYLYFTEKREIAP
jgi:hypothetical protein